MSRRSKKYTPNTFIFGYGSLMNTASRKRTLKKHVPAYPTIINKKFGFSKRFNTIAATRHGGNEIVLGLEKNPHKTTTVKGGLFPVTKQQENRINRREHVYKRISIPRKFINTTIKIPYGSKVYTYKSRKPRHKFNKPRRIYKDYTNRIAAGTTQLFGKKK